MKISTTNTAGISRCSRFLILMLVASFISVPMTVYAIPAAVDLGSATTFSVLAGTSITNTGSTIINGDIGSVTIGGFPPGILSGVNHAGDTVTQDAQIDLTTAYGNAAAQTPDTIYPPGSELGGLTLTPGVYNNSSSFGITGTLTLDANGESNAVWIFQTGSTLTTAVGSQVALINGAQACNIFWQVGSSATLGTNSVFQGTIMANISITLNTSATIKGRALAKTGTVTLDTATLKLPAIPIFWAYIMDYTGSKIYKVSNGELHTIPLGIDSDETVQPWEAFWFQVNTFPTKTMNFHPAQTNVRAELCDTLELSDKIYFVSFPLVVKDTPVQTLFDGTDFASGNLTQFLFQKVIGGEVKTYATDTADFKVQAGRGYAIQHHTAGKQLKVKTDWMKIDPELNEPVKLQLYVVDNPADYRTFNMLGNPFDHPIRVTSKYSTSKVFIEAETDTTEINGAAKIASGGYSNFVRNMKTMERWHIALAVADSSGILTDTFNEAGVISADGDIDRLIEFYSSEDLILPGNNVRLVLRNPEKPEDLKLCYDYRAGGQNIYKWNIELSTTLQAVDAKLSLGNLTNIPADYRIFINYPGSDDSIRVTSDTVLDIELSSQTPKTLVLTASRQEITGVNELSRPSALKIDSIYPNPFNPLTTISYTTKLPGRVSINIYSSTGQILDTLTDTNMSAGSHKVSWDGSGYSSGVYIVKVHSGSHTETRWMTLIK